jgi:DNA-binding ferritin-like protein
MSIQKYKTAFLCHYKGDRNAVNFLSEENIMKKKLLSVILAIMVIFTVTVMPVSAVDFERADEPFTKALADVVDSIMNSFAGVLNHIMKENDKFVDEKDYVYDNFFEGTAEFIDKTKEGASWSLGHSSLSLIPENWKDYDLFLGGFISEQNLFTNDVREVLDDMKVRVIALNDGSDRGTAVFATVDSIGMSNGDIRIVRGMLQDFAKENNLNSINIFATHTHSGIDTQGLWTEIYRKWPKNITSAISGIGKTEQGTDPEFMEFLYNRVATAIKEAVDNMTEGLMTYAEKDIGEKYFSNKNRPSASSLDTKLRRFIFAPYSKGEIPTMIINMSAHPDVVGLPVSDDETKGHGVSGDYIYYMGETITNAGYNFMFFNGAIAGIYIGRVAVKADKRVDIASNYGKEIGKMALGLTKTEKEIKADPYLMSLEFTKEQAQEWYTPWYKGWVPVKEREVEPILNLRLEKVEVHVTNPVIKAAGKLGVVNYIIKKVAKEYFVTTEIGYMEMGKDIKIAFVPGEICTDLIYGGASMTAEGSLRGRAYEGRPLNEIFGEDVIIFGLANDAIGYIIPDNDYAMALAFGHYHETLSLGEKTALTLTQAYENIIK